VKRLVYYLQTYKLLSWVLIGALVSLILQFSHLATATHLVIIVVSFITIVSLLWGMWLSIRAGVYSIDLPGVAAIIAAVILRQYWAALVVDFILVANLPLKNIFISRFHHQQSKLLNALPKQGHVFRKRRLIDIPINEIHTGDEIEIRPGEIVPLDAVIKLGDSNFNETCLTGDSHIQQRQVSETILAGTTNISHVIRAKVLRTDAEGQYRQLMRFERSAIGSPAPIMQQADFYSLFFMLGAYSLAAAAWLVSGQPIRFLEVIIIASPISFGLIPIFSLIAGLHQSVKYGIVIKTGSALEQLANAKTVVFDKTEILAHQAVKIENIVHFKPSSQRELLKLAGSITQRSNQALAKAVVQAVTTKKVRLLRAKHIQELPGFGFEAHIGSYNVMLGDSRLMQERQVVLPRHFKYTQVKQPAIYLAADNKLIGYLTYKYSFRDDLKPTLNQFGKLGIIRSLLLTDESQSAATRVAKQLGMTDIGSKIIPGEELLAIEQIKEKPLLYIGDGLTDVPIMVAADIGIAVGVLGSLAAGEPADVIIMQDNLETVTKALAVAKKVIRNIKLGIVLAVGLSLLAMLGLASGKVSPLDGAFIRAAIEIVILGSVLWIWRRFSV
jgi:P-type E1-E2 ATPase